MLRIAAPTPTRVLKFTSPAQRWLLLLPVALTLTGSFFTIRWCAGDTIARSAGNRELAEFAVHLAPSDPQTHFALGKLAESSLEPGAQDVAIREYETAVRLAPEDYRLWMIFAVGLERKGDLTRAETAYLQAEQMAPAYAMPHWAAGNFLLRRGRAEDAVPQLLSAGESMEPLRRSVLDLIFSYYDSHVDEAIRRIGPRPELRRSLLQLMLDRHWTSDALTVWNSLDPGERASAIPLGNRLIAALIAETEFEKARVVQNALSPGIVIDANKLLNGSFESDVATDGANLFGWRVNVGTQPQIALDSSQSHSLGRALLLAFDRVDNIPLRDVTQLVVVDPGRRYRLTYFVRSTETRGAAGIQVQVQDAANQVVLARSEPLPAGSTEWHAETLEFTAPTLHSGILIRLGSVNCPAEACPVFGRVWYDDLELKRND